MLIETLLKNESIHILLEMIIARQERRICLRTDELVYKRSGLKEKKNYHNLHTNQKEKHTGDNPFILFPMLC